MILIIAAKYKFEEHISVAASVKCFSLFNGQRVLVFETTAAIISKITHHCVIFKEISTKHLVISCFTDMLLT